MSRSHSLIFNFLKLSFADHFVSQTAIGGNLTTHYSEPWTTCGQRNSRRKTESSLILPTKLLCSYSENKWIAEGHGDGTSGKNKIYPRTIHQSHCQLTYPPRWARGTLARTSSTKSGDQSITTKIWWAQRFTSRSGGFQNTCFFFNVCGATLA